MKKRFISIAQYVAFFLIGVLLLWLAFRGEDLGKMFEKIRGANYWWIAIAIIAALLSHISRAIRWNMLIHPLGYQPKLSNTFLAVMVGYLANFALPRMGEVARCGVLTRYEKVPLNSLLGTVITERGIDLIGLIVLLFLALIVEMDRLSNFIYTIMLQPLFENISNQFSGIIISISIGFLCILALYLLIRLLFKRIRKSSIFYKIKRIIVGFLAGLKSVRKVKHPWLFIGHTVFIYLMYYLMAYLCFFALSATAHLDMGAGLIVLVIGSLGIVAPVQGGIGTYHWLVTEVLHNLYHLSWQDGLVFATLVHATQTAFIIFLGGISLILLPFLAKRRKAAHG